MLGRIVTNALPSSYQYFGVMVSKRNSKSNYSLVKYNNILKATNSRISGMTTYIGL
jgi:hypothetical protein